MHTVGLIAMNAILPRTLRLPRVLTKPRKIAVVAENGIVVKLKALRVFLQPGHLAVGSSNRQIRLKFL